MAIANVEFWGMNKDVQDWISAGCPWGAGITIFKNYVNNPVHLALFESGETSFTRKKLRAELEKLIPVKKEVAKSPAAVSEIPKYVANDLPEELRSEFIRKGELYKLSSVLHGMLFHAKSNSERAGIYQQIKSNFEEIDFIWNKSDEAMGHVHKPAEEIVVDENDRAKLLQKRNNLRSNLSKARAKNKTEKVAALELELQAVEQKLKDE